MTQNVHYIQWQNGKNKTLEAKASEVMKHWQTRYELGSALLLCEDPETTLKLLEKQWRKLSRQLQSNRETKVGADDILTVTRTISRMQRVKFSTEDPEVNPDAKFYVVTPKELSILPAHCYTLYNFSKLPEVSLLKLLPADSLVVSYSEETTLAGIYEKSVLEERILTEESKLISWLEKQHIVLDDLKENIEKANEALDTLLSSNNLQSEFLHRTGGFLNLVQLAQPVLLSPAQELRLTALSQLEHHVRVLSPAFLSDHIVDSQSDDSFLLRDPETGKVLTLETLRNFITAQYQAGRNHLATALEQKAGYIRL
jgi:hypothetical protein